jgi:hypothetical protein
MYDFVRRPSMAFDPKVMAEVQQQRQQEMNASPSLSVPPPNESPLTPMPDSVQFDDIDDEFNLPISVAICLLLGYMLLGAFCHSVTLEWTFQESLYFVFISISTIGEANECSDSKRIQINPISPLPIKVSAITFRSPRSTCSCRLSTSFSVSPSRPCASMSYRRRLATTSDRQAPKSSVCRWPRQHR